MQDRSWSQETTFEHFLIQHAAPLREALNRGALPFHSAWLSPCFLLHAAMCSLRLQYFNLSNFCHPREKIFKVLDPFYSQWQLNGHVSLLTTFPDSNKYWLFSNAHLQRLLNSRHNDHKHEFQRSFELRLQQFAFLQDCCTLVRLVFALFLPHSRWQHMAMKALPLFRSHWKQFIDHKQTMVT